MKRKALVTGAGGFIGHHLVNYLKSKGIWAGPLIREGVTQGVASKGYSFTGLSKGKPIVLVMGGSLGAGGINKVIESSLPDILVEFQLIHITGQGKKSSFQGDGYVQMEFVGKELCHLYAMADIILTRAGSNSIHEVLLCQKPMVLVPLPHSRGDQIQNADLFHKKGWAKVLKEEDLTFVSLNRCLKEILFSIKKKSSVRPHSSGNQVIIELLKKLCK